MHDAGRGNIRPAGETNCLEWRLGLAARRQRRTAHIDPKTGVIGAARLSLEPHRDRARAAQIFPRRQTNLVEENAALVIGRIAGYLQPVDAAFRPVPAPQYAVHPAPAHFALQCQRIDTQIAVIGFVRLAGDNKVDRPLHIGHVETANGKQPAEPICLDRTAEPAFDIVPRACRDAIEISGKRNRRSRNIRCVEARNRQPALVQRQLRIDASHLLAEYRHRFGIERERAIPRAEPGERIVFARQQRYQRIEIEIHESEFGPNIGPPLDRFGGNIAAKIGHIRLARIGKFDLVETIVAGLQIELRSR